MSNPNGTPSGTNGSPMAGASSNAVPPADAPQADSTVATQPPSQAGPSTSGAATSPAAQLKEDKDKDKEKDKAGKEKEKHKDKDVKPDPAGPDLSDLFAARREEENARRDRSLAEFLVMLDGYKPLIPEEVTEYYLQRAGFECADPRLKRLLSLSAQKFVSDLSREAYHYAKLRVNGTTAGRGRPSAGVDRNRVVLTMDDLSLALGDHGVNVKKPDYYL